MGTEVWVRDRECLDQLLNNKEGALSLKNTWLPRKQAYYCSETLHHCAVVSRAHFTSLSEVHQLRPVISHFAARIDALVTSVSESLTTPWTRVLWEANNSPASQTSRISWNPQFYYRAHNPDQCSSRSTFYLLQFVLILSFILCWGRTITLKLFCQKPVSTSSLHILATRLEDKYQK